MLLSGPSWPFLSCSQLGPDNNTYLAQIITPQNGFLLLFFMCWNTYFIVFFEHLPKFGKKWSKNDNFSHFAKHRLIKKKKRFCCNPPFDQKLVFFNFVFWNQKHWCWTKNITKNQEKNKDNKKGLQRNTRQETKKRENISGKNESQFKISCCSFHEPKAKKENEKETKTRNKKKTKKKDKKEEIKTRARERQRKRNRKRGGQKRLREKERETLKINKKCPF